MHATTPEICNNVDKQDIDDLHNVFHMLPFFRSDVGLVQRASKTHARGCGIFCQTLRNSREVDGEEGKALELAGHLKTLQAFLRDSSFIPPHCAIEHREPRSIVMKVGPLV